MFFEHYDEQKKYRTTTTITDDGKVTSVNIVFDEAIPIIDFNLSQRIQTAGQPFFSQPQMLRR